MGKILAGYLGTVTWTWAAKEHFFSKLSKRKRLAKTTKNSVVSPEGREGEHHPLKGYMARECLRRAGFPHPREKLEEGECSYLRSPCLERVINSSNLAYPHCPWSRASRRCERGCSETQPDLMGLSPRGL